MQKRHKRQIIFSFILVVMLALAASGGVAFGKAHVPAGQVQLSHKGRTAISVDAPALQAHINHGDFQLPACDFNNVIVPGADTSALSDTNGNDIFDFGDAGFNLTRMDAGGVTPACPPGTF